MIVNLTGHELTLGDKVIPGDKTKQARLATPNFEEGTSIDGVRTFKVTYGGVIGLPDPIEGIVYVVSAMVQAVVPERQDVFAPATGHPEAVKNEKGHILSVPGLVQA